MSFIGLHSLQATHTAAQTWVQPLVLPLGDEIFLEEFEMNKSIALLAATAASSLAYGDVIEFYLGGIESYGELGAINNFVITQDLGDIVITGIGWDNVIADGYYSEGLSWGSDMTLDVNGAFQVSFFPGEDGQTAGGVWGPASSGGIIDLADALGAPVALEGAELRLTFFESYVDNPYADAEYQSGIITIEYSVVPAPGALALLGLAGMGRRRRS